MQLNQSNKVLKKLKGMLDNSKKEYYQKYRLKNLENEDLFPDDPEYAGKCFLMNEDVEDPEFLN